MNADQPTNERHARGREMVEEFLRRFPERTDYCALACHAALPLALTPELLKYLRHEFLPHVSWVAEVDLLLSKLCDEAAEGVYVMKRDARAYLIRQMREDETLGELRIEAVNRILIERLDYLARNHLAILPHEWQTQRLSAMLYVTGQRDEAARALAEAIYRCVTRGAGEEAKAGAVATKTELARLTRLVREEAANLLDDYPDLVKLAQLIGEILADRGRRIVDDLRATGQLSQKFQLPGVDAQLPLLEYMVAGQIAAQATLLQTEEKHGAEVKPFAKLRDAVQPSGFKYACYLNYHGESEIINRVAQRFLDALRSELSSGTDKPIFMASRNLESGAFYSEALTRALYESACYIVLWAPVDRGNESLEPELESARLLAERRSRLGVESLKERGLIFPVILSAPESAPESLASIQWVDLSKTIASQRWFNTKDFKRKIRDIAEFVLDRCREAERVPEAFADPQDFALQVEAAELMRQAHGAMNLGQYDRARTGLERALKIHRERQDRDGEMLALNDQGELSYSAGDFAQALRCYSEALEIARSADARPHVAMVLDNLGLLYAATNQSTLAFESYQESLEISRELGDKNGEAAVLGNLGLLILAKGETREAIGYFEQQLKLAEEIGYEQRKGIALGNLGVAYSKLGQSQPAITFYKRAVAVFEKLGVVFNQAVALYQLGQELKKLVWGREEAIVCAERALDLYEQLQAAEAEEARALLAELRSEPSPTEETRPASILLSPFEFETFILDERGEIKERRKGQARQFLEELAPNVTFAMVEIPGGKFMMGSPENETGRWDAEGPQHEVTVPPFYIGKFAVTRADWRVVARWEKVEHELKPDPSQFKGDDHPVENVNWEDAKEFCARLTKKTSRLYRLPSEAEWEYTCRAGTTTPFAFGETITPEIVNYESDHPYAKAKKGGYRRMTITVGSLGVANAFGLFEMHGNVWEWCEDMWHSDYNGAPTDGTAWVSGGDTSRRVVRGGSFFDYARICRSAFRTNRGARLLDSRVGFRVAVSAGTL
jgi:formylglycine-generating enzyme required for sulfatase activity/Tfp pilus assembly protein PilF